MPATNDEDEVPAAVIKKVDQMPAEMPATDDEDEAPAAVDEAPAEKDDRSRGAARREGGRARGGQAGGPPAGGLWPGLGGGRQDSGQWGQ